MKHKELIESLKMDWHFTPIEETNYNHQNTFLFVESVKYYFNRSVCAVFGHDIELIGNEPSLESGMSENDFDCICNRCSI